MRHPWHPLQDYVDRPLFHTSGQAIKTRTSQCPPSAGCLNCFRPLPFTNDLRSKLHTTCEANFMAASKIERLPDALSTGFLCKAAGGCTHNALLFGTRRTFTTTHVTTSPRCLPVIAIGCSKSLSPDSLRSRHVGVEFLPANVQKPLEHSIKPSNPILGD